MEIDIGAKKEIPTTKVEMPKQIKPQQQEQEQSMNPLIQTIILPTDEVYAKTKAQAEVNAMSEIIQSPQKALNAKLSDKIGKEIEQSEEVDRKVAETTQILVDKGLEEQRNKAVAGVINSENETIEADFNKHKDEYIYHGIDHKIDKAWKRKLLLFINDFWFIIWAIVSCFTIVPVSTFLSRINALKGFIRGVAVVIGILLGLSCLCSLTYACLKWTGVLK